jgi:hypothetical protein
MWAMMMVFTCLEAMASGKASLARSDVTSVPSVRDSSLAPCRDVPGAGALFHRPEIHVVWVGEQHGTGEMPALLADLACLAGTQSRPVIVALERAEDEQADWDHFLVSDGSASAVEALMAAPVWSTVRDGRNSRAILEMAERLRRQKQVGRLGGIRLIDRWTSMPNGPNTDHRDRDMANAVLDIVRARPDALVLVYSGNIHAMKRRPSWLSANVQDPAASYLPPREVLSINLIGEKGEIWSCEASGCGRHVYPGEFGSHTRGVVLVGGVSGDHHSVQSIVSEGFDGLGYTGVPTTASMPAAPDTQTPTQNAIPPAAGDTQSKPPAITELPVKKSSAAR